MHGFNVLSEQNSNIKVGKNGFACNTSVESGIHDGAKLGSYYSFSLLLDSAVMYQAV